MSVAHHLTQVRERIQDACARSGRDPAGVTLVCVTKTVPPETIRQAIALGVRDLGENRVQEARGKAAALRSAGPQPLRWHLIGHLQRNKAKLAAELFDVIHSVDSEELAAELDRQATKRVTGGEWQVAGQPLGVFIQVNISGESTKSGCQPEEAEALARYVAEQPSLRLAGFMTIAPFADDPEQARPHFRRLRLLRDSLNLKLETFNLKLLLSMGMSHDFEVAIEEGADLIRVGTAIFGHRPA